MISTNHYGDIEVVVAARPVVALPRLWDFTLAATTNDGLVALQSPTLGDFQVSIRLDPVSAEGLRPYSSASHA